MNYESHTLTSLNLKREVRIDVYRSWLGNDPKTTALLLLNDGQELVHTEFDLILKQLQLNALIIVAVHAGSDRMNEYGMMRAPDYAGRGAKARQYFDFLDKELMPFLQFAYAKLEFTEKAIAGFSLGALSAIDIAWNRPDLFSIAGVFSGALWWRSVEQSSPLYSDEQSRMMHVQIRNDDPKPGLAFFLQCGLLEETADRNRNGVIDAVDDTRDLILELEKKGYLPGKNLYYLELKEGKHEMGTWIKALPVFLKWRWEKK